MDFRSRKRTYHNCDGPLVIQYRKFASFLSLLFLWRFGVFCWETKVVWCVSIPCLIFAARHITSLIWRMPWKEGNQTMMKKNKRIEALREGKTKGRHLKAIKQETMTEKI